MSIWGKFWPRHQKAEKKKASRPMHDRMLHKKQDTKMSIIVEPLSDKRPYIICTLALTTFVHLHVHQARQVSNEIVSRGWKIIRLVDTVVFAHELGTRPNGLRGKVLPGRSNFSNILGQKSNQFIFSLKPASFLPGIFQSSTTCPVNLFRSKC